MYSLTFLALALKIELWCVKVEPINVKYCKEYILECIYDEGFKQEIFCKEDYMDNGEEDGE